jgi:hypothetical protein
MSHGTGWDLQVNQTLTGQTLPEQSPILPRIISQRCAPLEDDLGHHLEPATNPLYEDGSNGNGNGHGGRKNSGRKLVIRGSYSKGLLLLKEETLPGAETNGLSGAQSEMPARLALKEASQISFAPSNVPSTTPCSSVESGNFDDGINATLWQLVKSYQEQNKIANQLIKHLTVQLEKRDAYLKTIGKNSNEHVLWWRLWENFRARLLLSKR